MHHSPCSFRIRTVLLTVPAVNFPAPTVIYMLYICCPQQLSNKTFSKMKKQLQHSVDLCQTNIHVSLSSDTTDIQTIQNHAKRTTEL